MSAPMRLEEAHNSTKEFEHSTIKFDSRWSLPVRAAWATPLVEPGKPHTWNFLQELDSSSTVLR